MENGRLVEKHEGYEELDKEFFWVIQEKSVPGRATG